MNSETMNTIVLINRNSTNQLITNSSVLLLLKKEAFIPFWLLRIKTNFHSQNERWTHSDVYDVSQ